MLRSQKDVDKHVQDIFRKITNEKERNLRCYNVAKLYEKVGDYQSTKKYVELYLRDRPNVAGAHKLLGQALEGLKDYPKSLEEYKCSLSLESRQPDLVLKVCELLVETKTKINSGEAKYWVERAEEVADNHQAVFRLKEYLLQMENGSGDHAQLAKLIEREIEARPLDHVPRIRLLNLYLESNKVIDAYKYAIELESRSLFRDNLQWYTCSVEVLKVFQRESTNLNAEFYVYQLSILERHVSLCFRDQLGGHSSNLSNALFAFDQACFEAFKFSQRDGDQLLLECLRHMSGQLCFHLATAWLRVGKQSRTTGWKECMPYAWALLTLAYSPQGTADFTSQNAKDKSRRHVKLWKEDAAFRCSQAGHILLSMPGDQQLERFSQRSSGNWREKVFSILFPVQMKGKPDAEKFSFFITNDRFANVPEVTPSHSEIARLDEIGQLHRPDSLHALVWLGLRHLEPPSKHASPCGIPYILPFKLSTGFVCHVFDEMKLSTINLETGGVETLSRLDIDTFLFASVFCAAAAQDERNNYWGEGRPSVLPVDLTDTLCTDAQSKWWLNTYKLHSNKSRNDIGEVRMVVSRGLEVVRLLGNHGMDVRLVVLLAKVFSEKASSLLTPKDDVPDISKRAQVFWQCAITLLERMERNQPLRISGSPMFVYAGKDLTSSEVKMLLEEGRFFLACRLMKEEKYEKAIEAFQGLKSPYASFNEGLMYKKLADAELMSLPNENVSSEMKSNYVILLQRSLSALHLTLDRLRLPQNAGNHPLNLELEQHLQEVENCLMREDSNFVFSVANRNSQEGILDDSFSSNRFEDSIQNASRFVNTSMHHPVLANLSRVNGQGLTSTPFKSKRNFDTTSNLDASQTQRLEARPSPERLDAQLRRMTMTNDAVVQIILEQNRQMLDALEKTRSSVEDLQKQMSDLKLEVGKLKVGDNRGQSGRNMDYSNMVARGAEECDYDVAASQFHSARGYPPSASYAHFPGQGYTYDNCAAANSVPIPTMMHQTLFPQAQMALPRNVDPNLLLASYYPMHTPIPNTMAGQIATPAQSNVPVAGIPASGDPASVDRKTSLMGTPIISHPTNHPIDLCASASISSGSQPLLPTVDLSAQRFSMVTQAGLAHGGKMPNSSVDTVPHNFQISMPPQATIPTTESLEKSLSPLKPISTDSILPNVPLPAYSAVSMKSSEIKPNRYSTGSASGNDTFTEDADYNPCADFKPVIPLPDEITVTTGEEDETVLFVRRAKLFRFVTGEWKERGIGDIKILKHNITGKPRILMRREQVHKICANHFILPEMELCTQKGSDRAWNWGANDFSDGEARIEKLCVRFKTVEDAEEFKKAFDDARKLAKDATPVKGPPQGVAKHESKTKVQVTPDPATPAAPAGKVELGGFSFISPPVLKPVERQVKASPGKDKENVAAVSKPSPFAGFSFTPASTNAFASVTGAATSSFVSTSTASPQQATPVFGSVSSTNSSATLFGQKVSATESTVTSSGPSLSDTPIFNNSTSLLDFAAIAAQSKGTDVAKKDSNFKGFVGAGSKVFGSTVSKGSEVNVSSSNDDSKTPDQDAAADEFEPTAVFNPVIPLPSLVDVRTGEEDEEVLFAERAKLLRFDASLKEWKERGVGKMKVLKNPGTGKVRLLMRREQVLKVCCNHFITKDLQFNLMKLSDKAITWSAQDFAEGEVSLEVFALRFKTPELMHAFKDVVESVQKNISDSATNSPASAPPKSSTTKNEQPLSELFKPKAGSWDCGNCYTRNNAEQTSCPCCSEPKPGCEAKPSESKPPTNTSFSFGIKANSTDDVKSTSGFTFGKVGAASSDKQPPLSELFKPKEGSWSCQSCYTRNGAELISCPCCSVPKPGCEGQVAETKPSQTSTFSFGIKNVSSEQPKPASGFAFGNIATEAKGKTPLAELFKPKEGSWSCDACYTRCDPDKTACVACEAPKPGHENDKKASGSTFNFGVSSAPSFSFGIPSSTTTDNEKGFSFGAASQPTSTSTSSGFIFGASTLATNPPSFGSLAASQSSSFGSPHTFEFKMKAQSPTKSPGKSPGAPSGEDDSDDDTVEENPDVGDFKPVVPLPDKVPIVTGEEDETVLYSHRVKLYRFVAGGEGASEWKERGLGDIKVLSHKVTNKPRLLMRREQVLKICLNHFILPDMELKPKDEKTWMWYAQDFSEGVLASEQFACRFKTAEIAADFAAAVEEAKKLTVLPSPGASTTPFKAKDDSSTKGSVSTKNVNSTAGDKPGVVRSLFGSSSQSDSASDEVEVVYEAKVTPEEKSAALKLMLPENFYRYKQAPPCDGCPGCEKDSDSDQADKQSSVDSTKAPAKSASATGFSFGSSSPAFGSGGSLFSSTSFSSPSSTLFGGSSSTTKPGSTSSIFGATSISNIGSTPSSIFGGTSSSSSTTTLPTIFGGTSSSNQSPAPSSIFGGSSNAASVTPTLGSLFGTANAGLASTAVNSPSTAFSILGSSAATKEEKSEKSESVSFLPVGNSPSFASLAAANPSGNVFKLGEPSKGNFAFDGAGAKVFGRATAATSTKKNNEEEKDSDGEQDATEVETHDPHFEPIIEMPDIVEVRTGEEDEERLFCRRAKLYRWDGKEWKERGVGEMKILKHPSGTFRLLLRREQVYKVVLNQRITSDMELVALNTSDKAWCWGGMNHAEDAEGVIEKLAARFKNSEEADEFRLKLEECKKMVLKVPGEAANDNEGDEDEEDEDDDDYEDDENAYEDEEGECEVVFEKQAALVADLLEPVENSRVEGKGAIRVILQPSHAYIVEMEDDSGQVLCRAPITGDVEVSREKNICIWKSFDLAEDYEQGIDKKFVVTFETEEDAEDFEECYSKYTLEIVEQSYDYLDNQED